jgi:hypothetical protein
LIWSSLSLTVNVIIEAGINARAIEKMNPPIIASAVPSIE